MYRRRTAAAALLAATLLAACSTETRVDEGAGGTTPSSRVVDAPGTTVGTTVGTTPDDELVLGLLVPRSGQLAELEDALVAPTELAVRQINDAGGVDGREVRLVVADDGSDPDVARTSLDELIEGGAHAVIGPASSTTTRGIIDEIRAGGIPVCSGSAYAADLDEARTDGLLFRTAPPDELQAEALAGQIQADGRTNVAILTRDDSYGDIMGDLVHEALGNAGVPVNIIVPHDPGGIGAKESVAQALQISPDAVVIVGFATDGEAVVRELVAAGQGPTTIGVYGTDGLRNAGFAAAVDADPSKVAGLSGVAPNPAPTGVTSPFNEAFAAVQVDGAAVDPVFSAHYWDCTNLLALAALQAGSTDPTAMRDAFAASFAGDTDCNDFATCAAALADGTTIHYRGASSTFDDWDGTQPGHGAYLEWSYLPDGTLVTETTQIDV